jgi:hypothetical protein
MGRLGFRPRQANKRRNCHSNSINKDTESASAASASGFILMTLSKVTRRTGAPPPTRTFSRRVTPDRVLALVVGQSPVTDSSKAIVHAMRHFRGYPVIRPSGKPDDKPISQVMPASVTSWALMAC